MRIPAVVLCLVVIVSATATGDVMYPFRNDKGIEYKAEERRESSHVHQVGEYLTGGASMDDPPILRVVRETAPSSTLMTPIPSCEKYVQVMGSVCRWGIYYCVLAYPLPVGSPCCCPAFNFCGTVTLN